MATLYRIDGQVEIPEELPVVALRDLVFFPYMVLPLLIGRGPSVAALRKAEETDNLLLLVAQRDADVEDPGEEDLHRLGTVIRVIQTTQLPDGTARVVMEGLGRARIREFVPWEEGFRASIELVPGSEREAPEEITSGDRSSRPKGSGAFQQLHRGQRKTPPGALRHGSGGSGPGSPLPHDLGAPPPLIHGETGTPGSR